MTTIHLAPGANVMTAPNHAGLDRVTEGAGLIARLGSAALAGLRRWRAERAAAHNDRLMLELAAADPRVLSDLRAARDRASR